VKSKPGRSSAEGCGEAGTRDVKIRSECGVMTHIPTNTMVYIK
jgi:hypothetical protein